MSELSQSGFVFFSLKKRSFSEKTLMSVLLVSESFSMIVLLRSLIFSKF